MLQHSLGGIRMDYELGIAKDAPTKAVASTFANSLDLALRLGTSNATCFLTTSHGRIYWSDGLAGDEGQDLSSISAIEIISSLDLANNETNVDCDETSRDVINVPTRAIRSHETVLGRIMSISSLPSKMIM